MLLLTSPNLLIPFIVIFLGASSAYFLLNFIKSDSKVQRNKALLRELLEGFELDIPEELSEDNGSIPKGIKPS